MSNLPHSPSRARKLYVVYSMSGCRLGRYFNDYHALEHVRHEAYNGVVCYVKEFSRQRFGALS